MVTIKACPRFTFTERAAVNEYDDAQILNSNNPGGNEIPEEMDVVVAGGGIHSLIYAIHAARFKPGNLRIAVLEKSTKPGYKIGESTFPLFSLWCKMHGLTGEYMLRLFGNKAGVCLYFLDRENQGEYTDICTTGTPASLVSGFQMERRISELLFTLVAQRNGVNVFHGCQVDTRDSTIQGGVQGNKITVKPGRDKPTTRISSSILVDATGRFRQQASRNSSLRRFEGWNYDAFWGYFTAPQDESNIRMRFYKGDDTNHLCFPEGWAWIIRLPSWEGSPIPNLMDMISYLLDCAEAGVPGDEVLCSEQLAKKFGLKFRWMTSIGFAVRNDVEYPEDMSAYGKSEAERKFNYFVQKYDLIKEFMTNFDLIEDHYGPGTTWFIRKSLTYQSPTVSGPGWLAIGDACGFTNPLYSPGITAAMATSTYAAELTHSALDRARGAASGAAAESAIRNTLVPYDEFCERLIPALNQMNRLSYVCFRNPQLGPQVSGLWQYLAGVGIPDWQLPKHKYSLDFGSYVPHSINWAWGSMVPEYQAVARKAIELISPIPLKEPVPEAIVREVIDFSNNIKRAAIDSNRFRYRWEGLLRYYDQSLNYRPEKTWKDNFSTQCKGCGAWVACHPSWRKCYACGKARTLEEALPVFNPPLSPEKAMELGVIEMSDRKNDGSIKR
ncbi:uncharacterized protein N7500_002831 [Penicillium coprophilum]|uniref:uncharacterized protein n=1 Tax=Penicillium coprophilum TaxID=36646 RepID=UPI002397513F|nr:uncharacterized protein N7500_002831 [Penicillium coprophilum]KAJ5170048.1 hypothetical protein N7500_002831 [Penicillium coprophilum]